MKKTVLLICFLLLISGIITMAQTKEQWSPVKTKSGSFLEINLSDLGDGKPDDIFVWAQENHINPLKLDNVEEPVYKTRTYYLINKKLMRYSILEIIYYNSRNSIIRDYNYRRNTEVTSFKYNYPVLADSEVEAILIKCMEYFYSNKSR